MGTTLQLLARGSRGRGRGGGRSSGHGYRGAVDDHQRQRHQ